MKNILKNIVNRKVGNSEIVEVEELDPDEEENIFLPMASDALNITEQYNQIVFFYQAGICQLTAKLEILREEFQACKDRNPIENIETRVKSPESIKGKMERRGFPLTVSSMVKNVMDIAGIRVVCPFISDVYYIAEFLLKQEDIQEIQVKDYIKNPKENGYRSLHLIVMVTVYFSDHKCNVPVEIQLRTIAMEFWATLEHQLRYKKNRNHQENMKKQLKQCADLVTTADYKMQQLADQWL
ncbi:MAG: GTP pyrophosphokinase family protein [Muricoprocola sp.]